MDFGSPGQSSTSFLDPAIGVEPSELVGSIATPDLGVNLDWESACFSVDDMTSMQLDPYPAPAPILGYSDVGDGLGLYGALGPAFGGFDGLPTPPVGTRRSGKRSSPAAQNSSRAARNGREQQRAQKISDMIDKLKGTLDRAKFTSVDPTSKLHVLMNCESYLQTLLDRTRCYEMEVKLRASARGHQERSNNTSIAIANTESGSNDIDWVKDGFLQPEDSLHGDTETLDGSDLHRANGASSSDDAKSIAEIFFAEASDGSSHMQAIGPYTSVASTRTISVSDSGGTSSMDDGDVGSTDGVAGVDTSVAAVDSSSQGFTTDSSSRGFTTDSSSRGFTTDSSSRGFTTDSSSRGFTTDSGCGDSSLAGDSGSAYSGDAASGDAGSADGGSEGSYEGAIGQRMGVVNYFDIFRLSNVPMAIASKDGVLVDVNDAMRSFGKLDQHPLKTLTVQSLVAAESLQALEATMKHMLASTTPPEDIAAARGTHGSSQSFQANAGIGDRPTLLTVSLVYDERGVASAFHVALIPRGQQPAPAGPFQGGHGSTTAFGAGSNSRESDVNEAWDGLEGRSVRFWEAQGESRPLKRRSTDSSLLGYM